MKLWRLTNISHKDRTYRNEFISCIVAANTEEEAKRIHPLPDEFTWDDEKGFWRDKDGMLLQEEYSMLAEWADTLNDIDIECIGETSFEQYFNNIVIKVYFSY